MSHRHYCDFAGHDWQCSENCECICGLPMEGHDHSECPVELRACPEHAAEQQRSIAEAMSQESDPESIQKWRERLSARPRCECGCVEADSKIVGFCIWCDHTYLAYNSEIEDLHFAKHCPGAPEQLRQSAQARFVKH
jgi:hypothetical protein